MNIKIFFAALVAAIFIGLFGALIFIERVPVGHVGVKVNLLGGDKGVDTEEVGPGRIFVGVNQDLFIFPTFTQTVAWTAGNDASIGSPNDESLVFQTSEGLTVSADVGASISVDPTKVSVLFQKYRKGMDEIVDSFVRNNIRDALVKESSVLSIESVYGVGKNDLITKVQARVQAEMAPLGIVVEKVYWINELRLPESVVAAINLKIAATQQAQQRENEVAKAKAQADIDRAKAQGEADSVLINAKAQAEANRLLAQSITQTLVDYKGLERWDGKLPTTTGGVVPFINVK